MLTSSQDPLERYRRLAVWGFAAMLPALGLIAAGSTIVWAPESEFYQALVSFSADPVRLWVFNLIAPLVTLSGGLLALMLNLWPLVQARREADGIALKLRLAGRFWNLAVVVLSALALAAILGYAVAENLDCLLGRQLAC